MKTTILFILLSLFCVPGYSGPCKTMEAVSHYAQSSTSRDMAKQKALNWCVESFQDRVQQCRRAGGQLGGSLDPKCEIVDHGLDSVGAYAISKSKNQLTCCF